MRLKAFYDESHMKTQSWNAVRRFFAPTETRTLISLAIIVGASAGMAAYVFISLIHAVEWLYRAPANWGSPFLAKLFIVIFPGLGGLVAGWLVNRFAPSAKGTGTSEVVYVLRRKGGDMPARVTGIKALASAFSIGTGGSTGPEGPVIQIGAGVGSIISRWSKLPLDYTRTLVAAGAAAGVAAVFNAPIAGVMFALEVLGLEFASQAFSMVVLATVTADITSHWLLGRQSFFTVPKYTFNRVEELGFYLVLGVLAAFLSKMFMDTYLKIEDSFEREKRIPPMAKPLVGGLLVGALGLMLPAVLGSGHDIIDQLVNPSKGSAIWPWYLLILLIAGKIIATSLTLGSGGSGGILVPSLLMGALLGEGVGRTASHLLANTAQPGAYAIVGMGAVFAGVTHAGFTSILLLFEVTNNYDVILPVMFSVGICLVVSKKLDPYSLDSRKLLRKGVRHYEKAHLSALDSFTVGDAMSKQVESIPQSLSLAKLTRFIERSPHTGFPVVDDEGKLVGVVTYNELHQTFNAGELPEAGIIARDVMRTQFPTAVPEEPLSEAVQRMESTRADRVIVVSPSDEKTVIGIITKGDILAIYSQLLK
jgi:chloride channel protein, CIC family